MVGDCISREMLVAITKQALKSQWLKRMKYIDVKSKTSITYQQAAQIQEVILESCFLWLLHPLTCLVTKSCAALWQPYGL